MTLLQVECMDEITPKNNSSSISIKFILTLWVKHEDAFDEAGDIFQWLTEEGILDYERISSVFL